MERQPAVTDESRIESCPPFENRKGPALTAIEGEATTAVVAFRKHSEKDGLACQSPVLRNEAGQRFHVGIARMIRPVAPAFPTRALRKEREELGTTM